MIIIDFVELFQTVKDRDSADYVENVTIGHFPLAGLLSERSNAKAVSIY
jgi:hypothetical protein